MKKTLEIDGALLELSNPDKLLYPDAGVSKEDLVDYLRLVAALMLPHLEERPLTLRRFPDGIDADGFYQKAASEHFPKWVRTTRVEKREGGANDQVVCGDERTLVYLANLGTLEFHAPLARIDEPERPDQMIFDLDPPEDYDDRVRRAALALKDALDARDLPSFVKSSGSRGFHVVVPLRRDHDFDAVRAQARAIAEAVAADAPDELTTEQRVSARKGRVFIDVLRNAYGQTAVAPYSPRARHDAPVAIPLAWSELERTDVHPRAITIKSVKRRLGQVEDPWKDFRSAQGRLRPSNG